MGSTAVRYMMQEMLSRKYILECTLQALVSDIVHFFLVQLYCSTYYKLTQNGQKYICSYSDVKQHKYTCISIVDSKAVKGHLYTHALHAYY